MGSTTYDWTDKTKTGLAKEEFDALWTAVNAIPATYALDDISDVVITGVTDHELLAWDSGTSKWINMTPTEAGLDAIYLKLDASNDPVTAALEVNDSITISDAVNPQLILNDSGGTYDYKIESSADYFKIFEDSTVKGRFYSTDNVWQWVAPSSQPSMFAGAFGIYQDETEDQLWAVWKEAGGTEHHARVARAKRTVIWLGAAQGDVNSASLTYIGANGDVGTLRFVDAATNNAVWNFGRPDDWDYGEIRITVYWSNVGASVSGNHYCPQRLVGWAVGEDVSTPSGNQIWGGAKTITGVSDAGKIEKLEIDDGSAQDLTGEDFFTYRFQRQGANGLDTSSQTLDIFGIKVELISV